MAAESDRVDGIICRVSGLPYLVSLHDGMQSYIDSYVKHTAQELHLGQHDAGINAVVTEPPVAQSSNT